MAPPSRASPSLLQRILENKAHTGRLHIIGKDRNSLDTMHSFLRASGIDLVGYVTRNRGMPSLQGGLYEAAMRAPPSVRAVP